MMGLNNIELISDRPLEVNLREIAEVKKRYPKHAVIASLMVESKREAWHEIVQRAEDAGADGLELNFGCPHGMSERGMGVGGRSGSGVCGDDHGVGEGEGAHAGDCEADAEYLRHSRDCAGGEARRRGCGVGDQYHQFDHGHRSRHADAEAECRWQESSHGGYCGPAVKPIALNMVQQVAGDAEGALPISGIGGIATWRDAAEFFLLGCGTVQVCTAAMHYGYRIVEDMIDGLRRMDEREGLRDH